MKRLVLLAPFVLAACAGADAAPFVASSPASSAAPSGQRMPVATVLDASDPAEAVRSPLLAMPTAAAATAPDPHAHHHHGAAAATAPTPAPAAPSSTDHHHHGGANP